MPQMFADLYAMRKYMRKKIVSAKKIFNFACLNIAICDARCIFVAGIWDSDGGKKNK